MQRYKPKKEPIEYEDSHVVAREQCPECAKIGGDTHCDNLAIYDDGHKHCFTCEYHENSQGERLSSPKISRELTPLEVSCVPLQARGISMQTCEAFGYGVAKYKGETVQVAPYYDADGILVAQKLRFKDKRFTWNGDAKNITLFGIVRQRTNGGKRCVITEGEVDALSVAEAIGLSWDVFSIPNGAQGAKRAIQKSLGNLQGYEQVVLMFDNDEPGLHAMKECAQLFKPNQARIAELPLKDANEMLKAGRKHELEQYVMFKNKVYKPDGIVSAEDMRERLKFRKVVYSWRFPYEGLQEKTLGIRPGEVAVITAGTGVGKSQISKEFVHHFMQQGAKIGMLCFEETVQTTFDKLVSIEMNERVDLKFIKRCLDSGQSREDMGEMVINDDKAYWDAFDATVGRKDANGNETFFAYDHWGSLEDVEELADKIRYYANSCQVDVVVLDHISIVVSGIEGGDERRIIDNLMTSLAEVAREVGVALIMISHLKRTDGKGHEIGGSVQLNQLRGSGAIAQLADIVIGAERNQQDKKNKNITTLRCLKARLTGDTGITDYLEYIPHTGRIIKVDSAETTEDNPFNNEDLEY